MARSLRYVVIDAATGDRVYACDDLNLLATFAVAHAGDARDLRVARADGSPFSVNQTRRVTRLMRDAINTNKEASPTLTIITPTSIACPMNGQSCIAACSLREDVCMHHATRKTPSLAESSAINEWARDVLGITTTKGRTTMATATATKTRKTSSTKARKSNNSSSVKEMNNMAAKKSNASKSTATGGNSAPVKAYAKWQKAQSSIGAIKNDPEGQKLLQAAVKAHPKMTLSTSESDALKKLARPASSSPRSRNGSTPRPKHDEQTVALAAEATSLQNNPVGGGEKGWAPVNPASVVLVREALGHSRKPIPEQLGMTKNELQKYATTGDRTVVTPEARDAMKAFIEKHLDPAAKTGRSKIRGVRLAVIAYVIAKDKGEAPGYKRASKTAAKSARRATAVKRTPRKATKSAAKKGGRK